MKDYFIVSVTIRYGIVYVRCEILDYIRYCDMA